MTRSTKDGFGYVSSAWYDEDILSLSTDTDLSSTSLVKTLIEPTSSEEEFLQSHRRQSTQESYQEARQSVRESLSYLRQLEGVRTEGLNIDYEEQRKRDVERKYQKQSVPILSERSRTDLLRRHYLRPSLEDLVMPFMTQLGLKGRSLSWNRKPVGKVAELLEFMSNNPIPVAHRKRSMHLQIVRELLDEEKKEEMENLAEETEIERRSREERETEEKKREEEVFSRYTEKEKMVIKENLGRVPTSRTSAFIPYGKEGIFTYKKQDAESFFKNDEMRVKSYDDYYANPVDFGNLRVRPSPTHEVVKDIT